MPTKITALSFRRHWFRDWFYNFALFFGHNFHSLYLCVEANLIGIVAALQTLFMKCQNLLITYKSDVSYTVKVCLKRQKKKEGKMLLLSSYSLIQLINHNINVLYTQHVLVLFMIRKWLRSKTIQQCFSVKKKRILNHCGTFK